MPRPFKHYLGESLNGSTIVSIDRENKTYTLRCTDCESERTVTFVAIYNVIKSKVACSNCRIGRWGKVGGARETHYSRLKTLAARRGKAWTLSFQEFSNIIGNTCFYCGDKGTERVSWDGNDSESLCGIDRIDSCKGYSADNIVPCCGICNRAKHTMSQQDFIMWIKRLTDYRSKI